MFIADVWSHITVATHPDEKVGRRGSTLSVCESSDCPDKPRLKPKLAPLKLLGSSLGVPVHTIPPEKKDFRGWTVGLSTTPLDIS